MKVIFVGMHNKEGKMPLCSSTKSGKLIDRIINEIKPIQWQKTNLYDTCTYPSNKSLRYELAKDWHMRIECDKDDIIVLLGAEVHDNFLYNEISHNIIKIAHPSSKRSHEAMNEYVLSAVAKIKKYCC